MAGRSAISQSTRLIFLLLYALGLYGLNVSISGEWALDFTAEQGWFLVGLLLLLTSSLLQEPGHTRPVDGFVSALSGLVAVLPVASAPAGVPPELFGTLRWALVGGLLALLCIAATAMVLNRSKTASDRAQRVSASATKIVQEFGRPAVVFGTVFFYFAAVFHFASVAALVKILAAGFTVIVLQPLERGHRVYARLREVWGPERDFPAIGEIVAYHNPSGASCRLLPGYSKVPTRVVVSEGDGPRFASPIRTERLDDQTWLRLRLKEPASGLKGRVAKGETGAKPLVFDVSAHQDDDPDQAARLIGVIAEGTTSEFARIELDDRAEPPPVPTCLRHPAPGF